MSDAADQVGRLGEDFWAWRAVQQPRGRDDIPRLERPDGWVPDWSQERVAGWTEDLEAFDLRWGGIDLVDAPVAVQIDHRLLGSALARVHWELERVRGWRRNPVFYVDQALGPIFDLLLTPPPLDTRAAALVAAAKNIPRIVDQARQNLDEALAPFARLAIEELSGVRGQLDRAIAALLTLLPQAHRDPLSQAASAGLDALESLAGWLEQRLSTMGDDTAVGWEHFSFFLREVALVPYTPDQLLAMGRQELERAIAFEAVEKGRNAGLPELELPGTAEELVEQGRLDELAVRAFYEQRGLLSQPDSLRHYLNLPLPAYLEPLTWLGVTDDLTSPSRLDADGISYVPAPRPDLPYFYLAFARDPRTGIAHEGVHYQQLALSYGHPDPIRRQYYDSGPNEGIAFYNEELMLQAGLFEDKPKSREIIYNFMRLRALRVEIDVQLAIGAYDIEQGASFLEQVVPMDRQTAREEAAFFAASPGQGLTYQIGKLQILRNLSDAIRLQGDDFDLRGYHDYVWLNGNLPLSLQRWEYLGLTDDLERLAQLTE